MQKDSLNIIFDKYTVSVSVEAVKKLIMKELRRLSKETGYSLNSLKIEFYFKENDGTLAYFSYLPDMAEGFFFNLAQFDGRSANQIIDVVRHEFAHYVVFMRKIGNPKNAHGTAWKRVCTELGAKPNTYATNSKTKHFSNM